MVMSQYTAACGYKIWAVNFAWIGMWAEEVEFPEIVVHDVELCYKTYCKRQWRDSLRFKVF